MRSVTLKLCNEKKHQRSRHSPNGFDIIEECQECFAAWIIKGITKEEIRLPDTWAQRVFTPTYNESQRDKKLKGKFEK